MEPGKQIFHLDYESEEEIKSQLKLIFEFITQIHLSQNEPNKTRTNLIPLHDPINNEHNMTATVIRKQVVRPSVKVIEKWIQLVISGGCF